MPEVAQDTLLDGRYRILNLIGSGGMADVYSAEDTHLERQLALKVLHRRFAQDAQFIERFRREASSAAALSHPNVVNVFDRGEHDGNYYIAMEYLPGRTLKEVIDSEAPLAQERAIDLGEQILKAAGFAHDRRVIHRDFKPHNVIVGSGDGVKVTDFGIARAGASEITETGSIMGTAQYLSPEQAQGRGVSAASDLYSIGVILYEMLAGRVLFAGESAVSIALKHVNEEPPPLRSLRPDVHPALAAAVMRALAKEPEDRYASAEDFVAALEDARARIAAGEDGAPAAALVPAPVEAVGDPAEEERARRRRLLFGLLPLLLVLTALGAFLLLRGEQVAVPQVVNTPLLQARTVLERAGLGFVVERVQSPAPVDQVVDQDPDPGADVDPGFAVRLFVSAGPGEALVPSVKGLSQARAVKQLSEAGFKVDTDPEPSRSIEKGRAIRTVPPEGTRAPRGSRLRLFVSSGPRLQTVPGVVGLSRSAAESRLEAEGFVAVVDERPSSEPRGRVVDQVPGRGARGAEGSAVTITVSAGSRKGSRSRRVPKVTGLSAAQARAELVAAGFSVDTHELTVTSSSRDGVVVEQRPDAGTRLERGGTVVLFVGEFRAPPAGGPPAPPPEVEDEEDMDEAGDQMTP